MGRDQLKQALDELHETKMMFGSPQAPYWFVGLEEGNHAPPHEAHTLIFNALSMLRECKKNGYRPLRGHECGTTTCPDNCHYKDAKFLRCLLSGNDYDVATQRTWMGYIKLLLAIEDGSFSLNEVKRYQKYHLAEIMNTPLNRQSALLELFPLHCNRQLPWPYTELSNIHEIEHLQTNQRYWDSVRNDQWAMIEAMITEHQPKIVYLASQNEFTDLLTDSNQALYLGVSEIDFEKNDRRAESSFFQIGRSTIVTGCHPTARGVTNKYWENLAIAVNQHTADYRHAA